jgi:hypothetical protein
VKIHTEPPSNQSLKYHAELELGGNSLKKKLINAYILYINITFQSKSRAALAWLRPPKYFCSILISLQYWVWVCGIEWRSNAPSGRAHGTYEIEKYEWVSMERK